MSNDSRQNGDASGVLVDGKYSVSLPVSSVAAPGASHQTWEHFCHEDQR